MRPNFTRRHYRAIAEVLKERRLSLRKNGVDDYGVISTIQHLADLFAEDNPLFNRTKFYEATNA